MKAPARARVRPPNRDHYAVIAGIQNYPGLTPTLSGPEKDAEDVVAWLTDPAGGGLPAGNIMLVKKPGPRSAGPKRKIRPSEARPSCDDILGPFSELFTKGFKSLETAETGGRIGGRLYIYVSGHGLSPGPGKALLLSAQATAATPFHVNLTAWVEDFAKSPFFDEVVLWTDCCMQDAIAVLPAGGAPRTVPRASSRAASRFMAFAADYQKVTVERRIGSRTRGVFTYVLLDALKGGAIDPARGRVTAGRLKSILKNGMRPYLSARDLKNRNIAQSPAILADDEDMTFGPQKPASSRTARVTIRLPGKAGELVSIIDGQLNVIAGPRTIRRQWALDLPVGTYGLVRSGLARPEKFEVPSGAPVLVEAEP